MTKLDDILLKNVLELIYKLFTVLDDIYNWFDRPVLVTKLGDRLLKKLLDDI